MNCPAELRVKLADCEREFADARREDAQDEAAYVEGMMGD